LNNIAQKYFANKSKKFQECPYYGEPSKYHQDILLFKGAKLLSNITNKDGTLLKNVIYEVVDWNETDLIVMKNDVPITTELKDIHKNFILGYVMTTHKSQGDTIDTKIQLAEIESMKDDNRLIYTALTRATNFENIVLV
jgi:ATP-dependent exoDNAse (exonuclease V) alpha subunit